MIEQHELGQKLVFHHIGVGTDRFEEAIQAYQSLAYTLRVQTDDALLNVRVAFVSPPTPGPLIEIVAPLGEDGPLKSFIKRKQFPSPYHTCYAIADSSALAEPLRNRGFMPLAEPRPAAAFGGALIQYFIHRFIGLVEFVENPPAMDQIRPPA